MSNQPRRRRAEYFAQNDVPVPNVADTSVDEEEKNSALPDVGYALPLEPTPAVPARELLATNTGVRLACTMSAMMGLFALFLCWAEQESRVIRRFSVQSACLTALHAAVGLGALLFGGLLGGIPFVGLMVKLACLLAYIAALILLVVARVKLMQHAWQGVRFTLPATLEKIIHRYY